MVPTRQQASRVQQPAGSTAGMSEKLAQWLFCCPLMAVRAVCRLQVYIIHRWGVLQLVC